MATRLTVEIDKVRFISARQVFRHVVPELRVSIYRRVPHQRRRANTLEVCFDISSRGFDKGWRLALSGARRYSRRARVRLASSTAGKTYERR